MKKSFTLIETIISLLIILVIMAAVTGVMYAGRNSYYVNKVKIDLFQKARNSLRRMEKEIIQSRNSFLSIPADSNNYDYLTFKLPESIDDSGVVTWSDDITYFLSGNELKRSQNGISYVIASDISSLSFKREISSPSVLEISVSALESTAFSAPLSVDLTVEVKLRN